MRDSNLEQQAQTETLPGYDRHVLLLIFKLLSAIDPKGKDITFADKQIFEDVLHYGSFSRVAELKKISPNTVSKCYHRVEKALEKAVADAPNALELRKEVEQLEQRLLKNERRLEMQQQELFILRREDKNARKIDEIVSSDPNTDYVDIKLSEMNLSKKFSDRLNRLKLFTVGDLLSLSPEYFNKAIGESSWARELKDSLEKMGLRLKTDNKQHREKPRNKADERHINRLEKKVTKLKEQLSLYEQDSQDKAATIAELRKELEERREQYREDSRSKDATIAELRKEKKERFAKYRQDLRDKNETIQLLSKEKKDAIKAQRELSRMISLQQTKREEEKPPRVTKKGKRLNRKIKDLEKKLHNMKAVYEYKLETLNTWKKGLEADLAASHKLINEQMSLIDRLQSEKENITKEPSFC